MPNWHFIEAKDGYYSFDCGGFHFVVPDCSFFKDENSIGIKPEFAGLTPEEIGLHSRPTGRWKEVFESGVISTISREDRYLPLN